MEALIALTAIGFVVLFIFGILALIGFVLKVLLWAVLFPIRLVLKLVFGLLGFGLAVLVVPVVVVVAGIALVGAIVAAIFALVAPLMPLLLVGLVGWAIYRISTGSSVRGFVGS